MTKKQRHLILIVHFVLWIILSLKVIGSLSLMQFDSPSGIYASSIENEPGGYLMIIDFPFIFNFVQKAWRYETTVTSGSSIYSVKNHLKVTSEWAGKKLNRSMPFGYSPTMLWILAPLVRFPHAVAHFLFNLVSLLAVFWLTHPYHNRWGIGLLMFFSMVAQACFALGQTALLTAAGLLFLAKKTNEDNRIHSWRNTLLTGSALWALTAKPSVALTAIAVLFGLRRWRTLFAAGILTILSTLIITPLLGSNWVSDYFHLLWSYDKVHAGSIFSWSLVPEYMANLRAILNVDIGLPDNYACNISAIAWLITLAYISISGLRDHLSTKALWSMSILSYLVFCPHVSWTEELQIVIILSLCVPPQNNLSWQELVLLIILPLLVFIPSISGSFRDIRLPLFLVQVFLFIFIAHKKSFAAAMVDGKGTEA